MSTLIYHDDEFGLLRDAVVGVLKFLGKGDGECLGVASVWHSLPRLSLMR